jgi:hypothetical protein
VSEGAGVRSGAHMRCTRDTFEGDQNLEWMVCTTPCLLSLPPSPFDNRTYSCHVYSDSELATFSSM